MPDTTVCAKEKLCGINKDKCCNKSEQCDPYSNECVGCKDTICKDGSCCKDATHCSNQGCCDPTLKCPDGTCCKEKCCGKDGRCCANEGLTCVNGDCLKKCGNKFCNPDDGETCVTNVLVNGEHIDLCVSNKCAWDKDMNVSPMDYEDSLNNDHVVCTASNGTTVSCSDPTVKGPYKRTHSINDLHGKCSSDDCFYKQTQKGITNVVFNQASGVCIGEDDCSKILDKCLTCPYPDGQHSACCIDPISKKFTGQVCDPRDVCSGGVCHRPITTGLCLQQKSGDPYVLWKTTQNINTSWLTSTPVTPHNSPTTYKPDYNEHTGVISYITNGSRTPCVISPKPSPHVEVPGFHVLDGANTREVFAWKGDDGSIVMKGNTAIWTRLFQQNSMYTESKKMTVVYSTNNTSGNKIVWKLVSIDVNGSQDAKMMTEYAGPAINPANSDVVWTRIN